LWPVYSLYHNLSNYQLNRLQQIQNSLARTVVKALKSSHITPILKYLHRLKVDERIEYKLLSLLGQLNTKFLQPEKPSYLHNLISLQPPCSTRSSSVVTFFSPTNHLLIENHRSLVQTCIISTLSSTSRFISSTSPVLSRFTSSFTSQPKWTYHARRFIHLLIHFST